MPRKNKYRVQERSYTIRGSCKKKNFVQDVKELLIILEIVMQKFFLMENQLLADPKKNNQKVFQKIQI